MNYRYLKCGLLIALCSGFLTACDPQSVNTPEQICFKSHCVGVEIMRSQKEKLKGLQNREYLGNDRGMLFVFPKNKVHSFWMKDTWIPLDIIWLDQARKVVHVEADVPPCVSDPCPSYAPLQNATYVLELNAGQVQKHKISIGTHEAKLKELNHSIKENKDQRSMADQTLQHVDVGGIASVFELDI